MMDIRQVSSLTETRPFDTQELRAAYLIEKIFQMGEICMTYSHLDRTVVGGAVPTRAALTLESNKQIGSPQFLDRRELGVFNIGGSGWVIIDNDTFELKGTDALYVPMGTANVTFTSDTVTWVAYSQRCWYWQLRLHLVYGG